MSSTKHTSWQRLAGDCKRLKCMLLVAVGLCPSATSGCPASASYVYCAHNSNQGAYSNSTTPQTPAAGSSYTIFAPYHHHSPLPTSRHGPPPLPGHTMSLFFSPSMSSRPLPFTPPPPTGTPPPTPHRPNSPFSPALLLLSLLQTVPSSSPFRAPPPPSNSHSSPPPPSLFSLSLPPPVLPLTSSLYDASSSP